MVFSTGRRQWIGVAGTAKTYQRIKAGDYFERVWRNLNSWKALGAKVSVKYTMKEESAGPDDRAGFAERCRTLRPTSVILGIDFDHADASPVVGEAIAALRHSVEGGQPPSFLWPYGRSIHARAGGGQEGGASLSTQ